MDYYMGLDCGTSSVGWALSDMDYKLFRIKGKKSWGFQLFDEAQTAAKRRLQRSARRRGARTRGRLKVLEMLFADEIARVDPDFYIRLRESFFVEADKRGLAKKSKNTLFNDKGFDDKVFHKNYPTIWHLRQHLMSTSEKPDIRLYFLAIHHILKNRGHFLYEGDMSTADDFAVVWRDFSKTTKELNIAIDEDSESAVKAVIKDTKKSKSDKKKVLKSLLFPSGQDGEAFGGGTELAGLLVGSKVKLSKIFDIEIEDEKSYSLADGDFEEGLAELGRTIGLDNASLVEAAKKLYDFGILSELMKNAKTISEAMVNNYQQHEADLKYLKSLLKPFKSQYDKLLKSKDEAISYNSYIGQTKIKGKTKKCSQEDLNKEIEKLLWEVVVGTKMPQKDTEYDALVSELDNKLADFLRRAKQRELLPKQKGQAKGTIPMQLHLNELRAILKNLARDYPSFAVQSDDDGFYNQQSTLAGKCKKIESLHMFRIPYYVGPLVTAQKSRFSWGDEEINQLIYPWNFDRLIDKKARANQFIRRMTNDDTYLLGEEVLPKCSMIYQKYLVLNDLNNLKINGMRLTDVKLKQDIYKRVFEDGEGPSTVTLTWLQKWLKTNRKIEGDFTLSGIDGSFKSNLSTKKDLIAILGQADFDKFNNQTIKVDGKVYKKLEYVIELITILGDEKAMLAEKIQETLGCSAAIAAKISQKNYKGWGNFSSKLLTGIKTNIKGRELSILDMMWETNNNFMELYASSQSPFRQQVDELNMAQQKSSSGKIEYDEIAKLYCSPAVKRTIWRALKIVQELVDMMGAPPKKIFMEMARENKTDKKRKLSRRHDLIELYKKIKSGEAEKLLRELNTLEDRALQSKKLYLYYTQMGRCAYSGEPIDIDRLNTPYYDIDHIYPKHLTKDDSIANNLVLAKREYNDMKGSDYPIPSEWRYKMAKTWEMWHHVYKKSGKNCGLITDEKYQRLTRPTALTADELGGFIARQLVETRQSTKVIAEVLKRVYPETDIVYSKAEQVSDFRKMFDGGEIKQWHSLQNKYVGTGKFRDNWGVKVRELNDFHHAKDAYLNIVVGNVYNTRFTSDPRRWIKSLSAAEKYTINPEILFSVDKAKHSWAWTAAWRGEGTLNIVKNTILRNDITWTRASRIRTGAISAQNIVGGKTDLLPIKKDTNRKAGEPDRLSNTKRYGGYEQLTGSFFALVEIDAKKDTRDRRLVQIPIISASDITGYINQKFSDKSPKIIIDKIPFGSLLKINGFPIHISGGTDFTHAKQVIFEPEIVFKIKKVVNVAEKLSANKDYKVSEDRDMVSPATNLELYRRFREKIKILAGKPSMEKVIQLIDSGEDAFKALDLETQCQILYRIIKLLSCSKERVDLQEIGGAKEEGRGVLNLNLSKYDSCALIYQSPTGLFEKKIDLKTVGQ